jgi:splicing factor 3A subunit 1
MTAEAFAEMHPNPIDLIVSVPNDPASANWNFNGQSITIQVAVTMGVKDLKEMLSVQFLGNLAANKMQLKTVALGFLKDTTLAALNIGPGTVLEVSAKSRGGKR